MNDKKHIDRLYQEKFKDFEVSPPEHVWQNISGKIQTKKKKPVIPFWFRITGAAALVALFFGIGNQFIPNAHQPIADTENPLFLEPKTTAGPFNNFIVDIETDLEFPEGIFENEKYNSPSGTVSAFNSKNTTGSASNNEENDQNPSFSGFNFASKGIKPAINNNSKYPFSISKNQENNNNDSFVFENENPLAALEKQKELAKDKDAINPSNNSKVKVRTFAAPIFYNGLGSGHSIDQQFTDNKQQAELTMSYGMNVTYAISGKVTLRSGISKVSMSYNTMDIAYGSAIDPVALDNVSYSKTAQQLFIVDASKPRQNSPVSEIQSVGRATNPGYLNQRLGFIEVPVEIEFALVNKRFGLNLIGGASTLILDDNSLSLYSGGYSTALGESNNLNPVSFSTNIGLGVDYQLTKRFQLNLEPMFKYQLNTFNSGSFNPYYMGIYTGLSYKF